MGDALISQVIEQFTMVITHHIQKEYRLVLGVEREIESIGTKLKSVHMVLENAERRQVSDADVKLWLESLKNVAYDMDDVICEWKTATWKMEQNDNEFGRKKVCFSFIPLSCFDFGRVVRRRDIAINIQNLNERLNAIAAEQNKYNFSITTGRGEERVVRPNSSSTIEVSEICGRKEDKSILISKLCSETSSSISAEVVQIVSIVGLGGIGKTTLAKLVYNCSEVNDHFDSKIWVSVSDPYDEVRVAKAIVEGVEGQAPDVAELETALQLVKNCVNGKKFLLVLDDLGHYHGRSWDQLQWNLNNGVPGSKVLVTTRNENIARMMKSSYIHLLGQLSDQDCWSLFSLVAFNGKSKEEKEELQDTGRRISNKCKGLPLFAYTIGGLMRSKSTSAGWRDVLKSEFWELEGAEEKLSPPLLISYYDLPSKLRQCFIYCAKFPKYDTIDADNLIKLWMAQGYLIGADMEATGRSYLDELIMRCFFQNLERDKELGIVTRFKMHDIVHDFAQYFTKNECFIVKADIQEQQKKVYSAGEIPRHLTLIRADDGPFPECIKHSEKLHTFWVQAFYDSPPIVSQIDVVPSDLFHKMKYLKALDLSHNRLRILPDNVDKVLNLRYLNLSYNPLEKLPESVCDLYNLQTLKLVACNHLRELPQGIGKLINLRHLEIDETDNLTILPQGIGQLSDLRTLSKFVIRRRNGDANVAPCGVGDLKNLNFLQGRLNIECLGSVADAGEAREAELKKKEDLLILSMNFSPVAQTDQIMCEEVAEALQPPINLVRLEMKSFRGSQFPKWIVSLTRLKKLVILGCEKSEQLPSLGGMPLLEKVYIESMNNLKRIDHQFLSSNAELGEEEIAFPKLKKLKIVKMRSLEVWDDFMIAASEGDSSRHMPNLHYLKLSQCDKLKTLPVSVLYRTTPPLKKLCIHKCQILQQRYRRGGENWIKLSHIPKLRLS